MPCLNCLNMPPIGRMFSKSDHQRFCLAKSHTKRPMLAKVFVVTREPGMSFVRIFEVTTVRPNLGQSCKYGECPKAVTALRMTQSRICLSRNQLRTRPPYASKSCRTEVRHALAAPFRTALVPSRHLRSGRRAEKVNAAGVVELFL